MTTSEQNGASNYPTYPDVTGLDPAFELEETLEEAIAQQAVESVEDIHEEDAL